MMMVYIVSTFMKNNKNCNIVIIGKHILKEFLYDTENIKKHIGNNVICTWSMFCKRGALYD